MLQELIIIKQIPDDYAEVTGLAKYNRSRMPRCMDRLSPALNIDGRYITGLDEDALEVNLIKDPDLKQEKRKELKELRESLERQTSYDLSGNSPFWQTYTVDIPSDEDKTLNKLNPRDVIAYHVLTANGYVAPTQDKAGEPRYRDAKYFAFSTEVDNKDRVSTRKIKDQARAELFKISEKKDTMKTIGEYLEGPKYTKNLGTDTLYAMLSDYLDENKDDAVEKFLKACNKDMAELQFKIIVDKAVRTKIIKYKDKYYQRGQVTLGRTIEELYSNLSLPEFAAEYLSIKEEIESRG